MCDAPKTNETSAAPVSWRRLELEVERINFKGEGYGIAEDGACYRVANALEGERVSAFEVTTFRRRVAYLDEVLLPSAESQSPFCPHWRDCGACQFSRLLSASQQKLKEAQWLRLIRRFVPSVARATSCSACRTLAYRHRARARFSSGRFVMPVRLDARLMLERYDAAACPRHVETEIPLHDCRLHADCLNLWMKYLETVLSPCPDASRFEFDIEAFEDNARLTIYALPEHLAAGRCLAHHVSCASPCANVPDFGVILQPIPGRGSHVYGPAECFGKRAWYGYGRNGRGERLEALKGAWTPVNPDNAMQIRDILRSCLAMPMAPVSRVLELGCGCGTHTDIFDDLSASYHGIDASWPAIQSAQHNAQIFQWQDRTFQTSTALHYLDKNYYRGARADLILMHSNRLPYSSEVVGWCRRFGAHTVLLVAPSAYALAKECQDLVAAGYEIQKIVFCDTMPFTYHMMGVAMLQCR